MSAPDTPTFEHLDVDACLELLAEHTTGRIAFVEEDQPVILPVNYLFDRGTVLVRTAHGGKLEAAMRGARVAFEIDGFDHEHRTGWSVLVKGKCVEVWEVPELERARQLPLEPWVPGERDHYLAVLSNSITGRRLQQPAVEGPAQPSKLADLWWG